jgi:hypothetical protein
MLRKRTGPTHVLCLQARPTRHEDTVRADLSGSAQDIGRIHMAILDAAERDNFQEGDLAHPALDRRALIGIGDQTGCPWRSWSNSTTRSRMPPSAINSCGVPQAKASSGFQIPRQFPQPLQPFDSIKFRAENGEFRLNFAPFLGPYRGVLIYDAYVCRRPRLDTCLTTLYH